MATSIEAEEETPLPSGTSDRTSTHLIAVVEVVEVVVVVVVVVVVEEEEEEKNVKLHLLQ